MNAPSDSPTSCENPEGDFGGTKPAPTEPGRQMLKGVSMVAAYRAARASQRSELRANLHQTHLARRRSREERLGRHSTGQETMPSPVLSEIPKIVEPAAAVAEDEATSGSVFASLISLAAAERVSTIAPDEPEPTPCDQKAAPVPVETVEPSVATQAADEPVAQPTEAPPTEILTEIPSEATAPAAEQPADHQASPAYDPPLAEIGFGPGMLIRLSQLGLHTTGDLARANASELRAALGDISRLVDVETWISNARQTTRPDH